MANNINRVQSNPSHITTGISRRGLLKTLAGGTAISMADMSRVFAAENPSIELGAAGQFSYKHLSADSQPEGLVSISAPANSFDFAAGRWSSWPHRDEQWIEYSWSEAVAINRVDLYWGQDNWDLALPDAVELLYWNGWRYEALPNLRVAQLTPNQFNTYHFDKIRTERIRLRIQPTAGKSVALLRWYVWSVGAVPSLVAPVTAGIDRCVTAGGATYLAGHAAWVLNNKGAVRWAKLIGPGDVNFAHADVLNTSARFSKTGDYILSLTGLVNGKVASSALRVQVAEPPPAKRLDVVYTTPYSISSPLWSKRAKALIVNWIPHCIDYCERTDLPTGQGGIDNFIEAGKALRGEPHAKHQGLVFSNAWVHQTLESICLALMVDPAGDVEMIAAQEKMRSTLERWIPIILAAQEPDGYLHTAYTLAARADWPEKWSPAHRADHEGYVAGYFIESAINHYTLTSGTDVRLYKAAKKLADCWGRNLGPNKKAWFDGHQEMEQALVRFGRFVNDVEGRGHGDAYIKLAKFLLGSREGGAQYDQSHLPPVQQYEAVGHAVRAVYFYSGMADIAAETGDVDYQSAVLSLWDNMVNRKYYVTGGVGSGDSSEGFGRDYALRHDAYCESCSSCGLIFFQYKMNLAYQDAKFADLYEETLYNALLGSIDLAGKSFCYTNPLINTERAKWHTCPCCVGNISRTLLMLPTWTYAKSSSGIYVNLFIGSRIRIPSVAGTQVELIQTTEYPWAGKIVITVNPEKSRRFSLHVRVPNRKTSELYTAEPAVSGLHPLQVNGEPIAVNIENGYAVITRKWRAGDEISFEIPVQIQRVFGDEKIHATQGLSALRYGPLMYSCETADQQNIEQPISNAPLHAEWKPDLLDGVIALNGKWNDGSPLLAIPYYTRENRNQMPIREFPPAHDSVEFAPGAIAAETDSVSSREEKNSVPARIRSRVWVRRLV